VDHQVVNVTDIETRLKKRFKITGTYKMDPVTGVVDVTGDVNLIRQVKQLGVTFGHVTGDFMCSQKMLETLAGAPKHVGKEFDCDGNNQLTSLEGLPETLKGVFFVSWNPKLPLLRSLVAKEIDLRGDLSFTNAKYGEMFQVRGILNKYAGEGKVGAIKAAAELIRAGFKDNARW
jgi:hypothetical protein